MNERIYGAFDQIKNSKNYVIAQNGLLVLPRSFSVDFKLDFLAKCTTQFRKIWMKLWSITIEFCNLLQNMSHSMLLCSQSLRVEVWTNAQYVSRPTHICRLIWVCVVSLLLLLKFVWNFFNSLSFHFPAPFHTNHPFHSITMYS